MRTNRTYGDQARTQEVVRERSLPAEVRILLVGLMCGMALLLARPQVAQGGWPLADAARVTVGFGALYGADGDTSRHRGTDLEAGPGAQVLAPLDGKVTFAGKVPAVGGGRVLAVTLETADGSVTLLPLARADVARGATVAENTPIGTLASGGDGSSDLTHLHVGLHKGDMYVDPLSVLAPAAPSDSGSGSGNAVESGVEVGAGASVGSGVTGGVTAGASGLPSGVSLAPKDAGAGSGVSELAGAGAGMGSGVTLAVPGGSQAVASAKAAGTAGETAADAVAGAVRHAATRAGGRAAEPRSTRDAARDQALEAVSAGLSALVSRARNAATHGARLGLYAALGVLGGIATLSPLWRGARKGIGKVSVSALEDDVVAAPTR